MPKKAKSDISKVTEWVDTFPNEFVRTNLDKLWCKLCPKTVACERKSQVDIHRGFTKHSTSLESLYPIDFTIVLSSSSFPEQLVRTFLKTDIPLHKLDDHVWQELFKSFQLPSISSSTAYRITKGFSKEKLEKIKILMVNKPIFLIADKTTINNTHLQIF